MTPEQLDPDVRRDLLTLSRETADLVARHLVVAGQLLDDDPARALVHTRAAGALAGRVAVVREATGLAAYAAGEWAEALSELRAARRMSGSPEVLPVLADCERALGRPERALALLDDPDVARLQQATRVELVVVVAGARRDLGQADAAVLLLQGPARATTARRPWAARLWYAYADALLDAGREAEAREWFGKVLEVDPDGGTDAGDRLLALEGVDFGDGDEDGEEAAPSALGAEELQELVADVPPLEVAAVDSASGAAGVTAPAPQAAHVDQVDVQVRPSQARPEAVGPDPAESAAVAAGAAPPLQGSLFSAPERPPTARRPATAAVPSVAFVPAPEADRGAVAGDPPPDDVRDDEQDA